jgi:hypothetical protein
MWVIANALHRFCHLHPPQGIDRTLQQGAAWAWTMSGNSLDELISYRQDGIEGGLWILQNHGDFAAADTPHLAIALAQQVLTFE